MKIYDVINRHAILAISADTPEQALLSAHISGENSFVRERDDSPYDSFIVSLVAYAVKQFGVLIAFSHFCRNILESEICLRDKLKDYTTDTGFGSEHLLYGLAALGDELTREFFRKKGVTAENILTGIGGTCIYKVREPENLLIENFIETIYRCGVYLDTRTLFLSILRRGLNAAKVVRFLGFEPKEIIQEYADFCNIGRYFLTNNNLLQIRDENCFDGIDLFTYVKNQSIRQSRITQHLKDCGLCLRSLAYIETSKELIYGDGNAPALW